MERHQRLHQIERAGAARLPAQRCGNSRIGLVEVVTLAFDLENFFEVRARLGGAIEFEQHRRQRLARLGVVRTQRRPKLGRLERLAVLLSIDCGKRGALGHARVARPLGDAPERERGNVDLAAMAGNFAKQDVVEDVVVERNLGQSLGDRLRRRYRRARRRQAGAGGQPGN